MVILPDAIFTDRDLKPKHIGMYAQILNLSDEGIFLGSYSKLSRLTNTCSNTVRVLCEELERRGFIKLTWIKSGTTCEIEIL